MTLRPFTLTSDSLVYTNDVADFQFPAVTKNGARCVVVGLSGRPTGANVATVGAWNTFIQALTIAGRSYVQNEVNFSLIDTHSVFSTQPLAVGARPRWPGSVPLLPDGSLAAGLGLASGEEVRMRLRRFSSGAYVDQVTLHCVQFPDNPADPLNQVWERLTRQGIGEALFMGFNREGWPVAGTQQLFDLLPQPPRARALRRHFTRGAVLLANTPVNGEVGVAASAALNNLLVRTYTSQNRPPQNAAVPGRAALGIPGSDPWIGLVDLDSRERSAVEITYLGALNGDADIHFCTLFEGRDITAPQLGAATAIS